MELHWMLISLFLSLLLSSALMKYIFFQSPNSKKRLPPSPPTLPLLGNLLWIGKSFADIGHVPRQLRAKYGPIVTLYFGSRPAIFVADPSLAHTALVQKGSVFADRPTITEVDRIFTSNQHTIGSAAYGPVWRLLRRNLMSEIVHPSRVKSFAEGRKWVIEVLIGRLRSHEERGEPVRVAEMFQHATFCLLLFICFGKKFEESTVKAIGEMHHRLLTAFASKFHILAVLPRLGRLIFRDLWKMVLELKEERDRLLVPLIRARRDEKNKKKSSADFCYVDSLLALEIPEEGGRKLTESEMVTLSFEVLTGGTDTTWTAMQWILANLVKDQEKQAKLVEEIQGVVGKEGEIREEDLEKMPYLKAVILEGLRRHPPAHLLLPHAVSEETTLGGYVIPKDATINFVVSEIGVDKEAWEDALEFRPERFLKGDEAVDITGAREIKMMPFGAGRRICPALSLGMLHLQYFLANVVREFEWKPKKDGEIIDLTETFEFTVVMKNPLQARVVSRRK